MYQTLGSRVKAFSNCYIIAEKGVNLTTTRRGEPRPLVRRLKTRMQ